MPDTQASQTCSLWGFSGTPTMADVLPSATLLNTFLSGWSLKNFPPFPLSCPIPEAHIFFSHLTPPYSPPCQVAFKITQSALFSETTVAQSTLKVLAISNAATSSLCCTLMPHAYPHPGLCLEMPQKSVPKLQETQVSVFSGSREASSQLGLSEGTQPLSEARRTTQHSDNSKPSLPYT